MKSIVAMSIIVLLTLTAVLQAAEPTTAGQRLRVRMRDSRLIDIRQGVVTPEGIMGIDRNGSEITVPRDSVWSVQARQGTYARRGLGIGFMVGLALMVGAVYDASDGLKSEINTSRLVTVSLIAIGGASAAGFAIGAFCPRYEKVSTDEVWSTGASLTPAVSLSLRF